MPCYFPLSAVVTGVRPDGKKVITVVGKKKTDKVLSDSVISIPCGQCVGCRLERSRSWAVRCVHESSLYDSNCFITLTFNDDNVGLGSLVKSDFVNFMKRFRKRFGSGIRFFHCGEYGELNLRPHHHACIFNFDFPDKYVWSVRDGVTLYRSDILDRLWSRRVNLPELAKYFSEYSLRSMIDNGTIFAEPCGKRYRWYMKLGFTTVGDVTFESAAYVARYIMKKVNGSAADSYYRGRVPEYVTMSRRPGIGKGWFDKFHKDVYPHDYVIIRNGIKCKPSKYYDSLYDLTFPDSMCILKEKRQELAINNPDNTLDRLAVRCKVKESKVKQLRRAL